MKEKNKKLEKFMKDNFLTPARVKRTQYNNLITLKNNNVRPKFKTIMNLYDLCKKLDINVEVNDINDLFR